MHSLPLNLNGFPVIAAYRSRRKPYEFAVVVRRGDSDFVSAFWNQHLRETWCSGFYTTNEQEAQSDAMYRAGRMTLAELIAAQN